MNTTTAAREKLHAFYAAHPDIEGADGEQLLALPPALLAELDQLLAAATAERPGVLAVDPATGVREILPTFPGGMADGVRVFTTGRDAKGRYASFDAVRVTVTARGHWYRLGDARDGLHNDTVCRGCGHHGHFNYILDYRLCTRPATAEDVLAALSGPARHVQPGDRVRLTIHDVPGFVYGTVARIYRGADVAETADVEYGAGQTVSKTLALLSVA